MKRGLGPLFCVVFIDQECTFDIQDVMLVEVAEKETDAPCISVTFKNNIYRSFQWKDKDAVLQLYADLKQAMLESR